MQLASHGVDHLIGHHPLVVHLNSEVISVLASKLCAWNVKTKESRHGSSDILELSIHARHEVVVYLVYLCVAPDNVADLSAHACKFDALDVVAHDSRLKGTSAEVGPLGIEVVAG